MSDDKIDLILERLTSIESKLDRLILRLEILEVAMPAEHYQPVVDDERAAEILAVSRETEKRRDEILSTSQNVVNLADINALLQ